MAGLQNFIQHLTTMQWSDYLDIALVAYGIYCLLPLIRTPNTMRIARAVLVVLAIAWLTGEMKLYTVNYILTRSWLSVFWRWSCCFSRSCGECWIGWVTCG